MSIKIRNLYILLCLALLFGNCSITKDEDNPKPYPPQTPQIPPETQEGKGTFGCYVNGELWLPGGEGVAGNGITWSHSYHDQISVSGEKRYKLDDEIVYEIVSLGVLNGVTGEGIYNLVGNGKLGIFIQTPPGCVMETDSINSGILEITRWDMERYIVSGRFSFTVVEQGCDTVRVTDGRFDVKL